MRKLLAALAIVAVTIVPLATMPGCSLIQGQRQTLAEMPAQDFAQLKVDVFDLGKRAGSELKGKLDAEEVKIAETAVKFIFEKSNTERGKLLADLVKDPKYKDLVGPAVSAALDLMEAAIGERLELESLGVTTREAELLEALLLGMVEGVK